MSHDESLKRTFEERKSEHLRECGVLTPVELQSVRLAFAKDEIRRLRRALRLIDYIAVGDRDTNVGLLCDRIKSIATRALKGVR